MKDVDEFYHTSWQAPFKRGDWIYCWVVNAGAGSIHGAHVGYNQFTIKKLN